MRIERIVITGDVLRTEDGDPHQLYNVRWLHGELSHLLRKLTGLQPAIAYRRNAPDGGRAVVAEWYGLLGRAPSLAAWAATYGETAPPAALADALRHDYEGALVVAFELSPLMRAVLDRIGVPWVDIEVSPVRFLDDLALTLRFSWISGPIAASHPGLLTPGHVRDTVARLRARHCNDAQAAACSGACIFLAQTRHDRTLIKAGAFFPDEEAVERAAPALSGRPLVLKPYPLAPDNPLLDALRRRFPARVTEANIYALLSAARDAEYLTISSSAAIEARHFGCRAKMFHEAAHARPAAAVSLWAHRSAAFWRAVLAPLLPLNRAADFEEPVIPDRLRRSLGAWSFTRPPPQEAPAPRVRAVS
jgi:hypothetical protein